MWVLKSKRTINESSLFDIAGIAWVATAIQKTVRCIIFKITFSWFALTQQEMFLALSCLICKALSRGWTFFCQVETTSRRFQIPDLSRSYFGLSSDVFRHAWWKFEPISFHIKRGLSHVNSKPVVTITVSVTMRKTTDETSYLYQ